MNKMNKLQWDKQNKFSLDMFIVALQSTTLLEVYYNNYW